MSGLIKYGSFYVNGLMVISRPLNRQLYELQDASKRHVATIAKHVVGLAKFFVTEACNLLVRSRMDFIVLQPIGERECS